ncbi:E3 ubiquitin-protein ligase HEL1 Ecym_6331 [Eremothecium cymbalariae DBVPG|uniref:RBR-type E3 ubiquitin transferase n=1 Tax=Eremothecium cymbalariae (strain CBS 270.75 / DBVPG 7215 / KCTC 17166 / NRRL Y-17582) TaxID=931890 RepID=G8JUC7_ERECY|nr:hypothetical protein Ecym_6331 [Eremothecium cymbalariae DBVPG\
MTRNIYMDDNDVYEFQAEDDDGDDDDDDDEFSIEFYNHKDNDSVIFQNDIFCEDELDQQVPLRHKGIMSKIVDCKYKEYGDEDKGILEDDLPIIEYSCLTAGNIYSLMLNRASKLQPVFNIPISDVIVLLQKYNWCEERMLEAYTDDAKAVLDSAGILIGENSELFSRLKTRDGFVCPICCESSETMKTFSLECGHEYCLTCYQHYISDKLNVGNIIKCMNCELALKNDDIDIIMGEGSSTKLMLSSIKGFIQKHSQYYKWCPFTDCKYVIHVKNTMSLTQLNRKYLSPYVICDNKHQFCFNCSLEVHAPCDCIVASFWVRKAQEESENLNWMLQNTKECPKCNVNIEKNGGCNHMTCRSCSYEFCWLCEGDWSTHKGSYYQCILYDEKKQNKKGDDEKKIKLHKYSYYYKLFNVHESSAQLDMKLGLTVEQKVKSLQDNLGISWIEGQFIPEAIEKIVNGRTVLKWSFAVAYYSDHSHNMYKILEQNQMELSKAVEELSELLEIKDPKQIMDRKLDFYNMSDYVEKRSNALVECGRELLIKGICIPRDS